MKVYYTITQNIVGISAIKPISDWRSVERNKADCLEIRLIAPSTNVPAALFELFCYA